MAEGLVRLSVNMNLETADALQKYAESKALSYTESVRRAIAIMVYLQEEVDSGNKIIIRDPETGKEREFVLLR